MHLSGVENERNPPIRKALRDRSDTVAAELNIENRGCEVFALRESKRGLHGVRWPDDLRPRPVKSHCN